MKEQICGIYMIHNKINNKIYTGQAIDIYERWNEHIRDLRGRRHPNNHLQRAWNLYGERNFEFSIIEECPEDKLNEREIYWIAKYDSYHNGYNQTLGGGGTRGYKHSDKTKQKMSEAATGANNHNFGKNMPDEIRKKISEAMSAENGYWYGKHHTEESKKKMSEANSGANHPQCKPVYCYELDEYFWGAKEATDKYGINGSSIAGCCIGRLQSAGKHPVTGEKLHWVYVDDMDNSFVA